MENVLEKMKEAVLDGDEDEAIELAQKVLEENLNPIKSMDEGFLKGIQEAGALFEEGEYFLPDLVCSADAMKAAFEILSPELEKLSGSNESAGKVVIATVQGDIHDIGKTIVAAMLTANGFDVIDLGADVKNEKVIETLKENDADIVALSALLTTTMEEQKSIIQILEAEDMRSKVKVMVGGAPVNKEWADKINADGYADNAIEAVAIAKKLVGNPS